MLGYCKDSNHLEWITNREGEKGSDMYNLRADRKRAGCVDIKDPKVHGAKFLILYFETSESDNKYRVFRIHNGECKSREWLLSTGYKQKSSPKKGIEIKKYYCYYLEEEVSLGQLSINKLLAYKRISAGAKYIEGAPIFVEGAEVLEYREDPPKPANCKSSESIF